MRREKIIWAYIVICRKSGCARGEGAIRGSGCGSKNGVGANGDSGECVAGPISERVLHQNACGGVVSIWHALNAGVAYRMCVPPIFSQATCAHEAPHHISPRHRSVSNRGIGRRLFSESRRSEALLTCGWEYWRATALFCEHAGSAAPAVPAPTACSRRR
eukprot:scaffold6361_cov132-Isochrysis_galbana.AAC.15